MKRLVSFCTSALRRYRRLILIASVCIILAGGFALAKYEYFAPHRIIPTTQTIATAQTIPTAQNSAVIKSEKPSEEKPGPSVDKKPLINEDVLINQAKIKYDDTQSYGGFTIFTLRYSKNVYIIDMQGHIVHTWHIPFDSVWPNPTHITNRAVCGDKVLIKSATPFPNGDLLATYTCPGTGSVTGYGMAKFNKSSDKVLWTYDKNTHHNAYIDKTGNIYTLYHMPLPLSLIFHKPMLGEGLADYIAILSPEGKELKTISILNAFDRSPLFRQALIQYLAFLLNQPGGLQRMDILHSNSVMKLEPKIASKFPMFKAGQVLVSLRDMNAIAVIDPETESVVWFALGPWKRQHSAQFLANGHILLLDNQGLADEERKQESLTKNNNKVLNNKVQGEETSYFSRILEYDPTTRSVTWDFSGSPELPFATSYVGDVQRLQNGNTMILDSLHGHIFEINNDKKVVWDCQLPAVDEAAFRKPDLSMQARIFSATRYSASDLPFLAP